MTPDEFKDIQSLLGLTNARIAEELGVSETTIEYWRAGSRNISPRSEKTIEYLVQIRRGENNADR
jgi:DNA-binding transcriptional regulator YiaG